MASDFFSSLWRTGLYIHTQVQNGALAPRPEGKETHADLNHPLHQDIQRLSSCHHALKCTQDHMRMGFVLLIRTVR